MSSSREGVLLRGGAAQQATPYRSAVPPQPSPVERRTTIRRAEDQPVPGGRPSFRLRDGYAEEADRLRNQCRPVGYAARPAEGIAAAEAVVAERERAAAARRAEVQARWERRLASATAALGAAVTRVDEAGGPGAGDIRAAGGG